MDEYSSVPSDAPRPRLCHLSKWEDYTGYGFNLHAERGKAGQFVGTIDLGSPAEVTELRAGDRIVEVNGTNIGSENHQQVVQRIKAVANETTILVVDSETDAYYRDRKIVVRGDMPNIERHETPELNPFTHRNSGHRHRVEVQVRIVSSSNQFKLYLATMGSTLISFKVGEQCCTVSLDRWIRRESLELKITHPLVQ